jgi:DNA replication protein DnaC
MNEITTTKMKQIKLYGMHNAFKTAIESGKTDHYTLDQFIAMLTDAEWDEHHNRRIERSIKNARFHYKSNIENIYFDASRNLDRNMVLRLAVCDFVEKNHNVLITGSTGVDKSFLGTALGYQACIQGYKVSFYNNLSCSLN